MKAKELLSHLLARRSSLKQSHKSKCENRLDKLEMSGKQANVKEEGAAVECKFQELRRECTGAGQYVTVATVVCGSCHKGQEMVVRPIGWWVSAMCTFCRREMRHPEHWCFSRSDNECHCDCDGECAECFPQ